MASVVHKKLKDSFSSKIPSNKTIAEQAIEAALDGHKGDAAWIKANFSALVANVQELAYRRYLEAEALAGGESLRQVFEEIVGNNPSAASVLAALQEEFASLDRFFLGLTQGRRPRAGKAFEALIRELFTTLNYPFSAQAIINGQPDFVLPSVEHFRRNAMDCVIFTAKRTLRERWRQIVTEGTRGLGFFLATIDSDIAKRDLDEMLRSRIYIVVPTTVKSCRPDYSVADNVITFEHFFQYYLDPAMDRWRAGGVIA